MDKRSIAEIRKLIKPDSCITRLRGCYVNEEGEVIRELHDSIGAMEKDSLEKYCEVLRSGISGKVGRNLFTMEFPLGQELHGDSYKLLHALQQSELKDDALLTTYYKQIIEHFQIDSKYLILVLHGLYDIPAKGRDNEEMEDASDYVYSFLLTCICPVRLMKEGLCYDEEACTFLDRRTDWAVQKPVLGMLFPAFEDRQPDLHSLLYYCRKEEERHEEICSDLFGLSLPIAETDQRALFTSIVEQTLGRSCDFENVRNLTEAVGDLIRENEDAGEPVQIEREQMRRLLSENGAEQSVLSDFDEAYDEAVGEGVPLMAENLVDTSKLEVKSDHMKLNVKAEMSEMVQTRVIDGVEYLLIPIGDGLTVNGIRVLQTQK